MYLVQGVIRYLQVFFFRWLFFKAQFNQVLVSSIVEGRKMQCAHRYAVSLATICIPSPVRTVQTIKLHCYSDGILMFFNQLDSAAFVFLNGWLGDLNIITNNL
jgi:hypothetical protein